MNPEVTLEREDPLSADAQVRDYDELRHAAQAEFPALVEEETTFVADEVAADLSDGELVRYGDYYRVNVAE
jgi:hypothetical protein